MIRHSGRPQKMSYAKRRPPVGNAYRGIAPVGNAYRGIAPVRNASRGIAPARNVYRGSAAVGNALCGVPLGTTQRRRLPLAERHRGRSLQGPVILYVRAATRLAILCLVLFLPAGAALAAAGGSRLATAISESIDAVQAKAVKIYGAGGLQGLASYQSGMLISPEGHVLTVFSHVLDTDELHVTLNDGRRFEAKLLGADPRLEVAVLKIEATNLPCFDLAQAVEVEEGERVLAFSNMFGVATGDEPVTVQHGTVAVKTQLEARQGVFETPYNGPVYVLDMTTNNPGAEGGLLVTRHGELVAMLGKELRNARNNTYLNYAIPIGELRESVKLIREGKFVARPDEAKKKPDRPITLAALGLGLLPDVVDRTPPYVDRVMSSSPAASAGLKPDDLVVLVGDHLIQSCKALKDELERIDDADPVKLTVLRAREMVEVTLKVQPADEQ